MLLDLELPDLDGLTVLQRVKALAPETSVVIATRTPRPRVHPASRGVGAAGYVLKGITRREVVATVGAVCEGESVLAPTRSGASWSRWRRPRRRATAGRGRGG